MRFAVRSLIVTAVLVCIAPFAFAADPHGATSAASAPAVSADSALKMLQDGNARFVGGTAQNPHRDQNRRCDTFANGQHPVAAILSCADSRAPVEVVFDQGIGDLFVIRVAGNIADTSEIGSLEYGVGHLNIPLIVVLGHSKCGAVTAVAKNETVHDSIAALAEHIAPAVEKSRKHDPQLTGDGLVAACVKANVYQGIEDIFAKSPSIREAAKSGKVKIVGAIYDLHNGTTEWLGAHPEESKLFQAPAKAPAHSDPHAAPAHDDPHAKPAAPKEAPKDGHNGHTEATPAATSSEPVQASITPTGDFLRLVGLMSIASVVAGLLIRFLGLNKKSAPAD